MRRAACLSTGAAIALLAAACGGGGGGGNVCSPAQSATITITAAGVSPNQVCLLPGGTVTFTNSDAAPHDIEGDASCPLLNLGPIAANTSKSATFPTSQTCQFHDQANGNASNTAFQGTVAVTATGGY
jgi:plastocyanin